MALKENADQQQQQGIAKKEVLLWDMRVACAVLKKLSFIVPGEIVLQ